MHKEDSTLNNLQWLIWDKIKPNQTKPIIEIWPCFTPVHNGVGAE